MQAEKNRFITLCFACFVAVLFSVSASAQGVTVVDCNGKTRATRNIQSPSGNNVEVDAIDAAGKAPKQGTLKLTNSIGKSRLAQIKDGTAVFADVPDGVWLLTSNTPGLFFTTIAFSEIIPPGFFESAANVGLVAGSIVGGVVLYNVIKNSTDGSGGGSGDDDPDPPANDGDCATCNPDMMAPSIPSF